MQPYYIVTIVFHESSDNLFEQIQELQYRMAVLGFEDHCIHSSPAIRAEEGYREMDVVLRRKLMMNFLSFIRKRNIRYKCFFAKKTPEETQADVLSVLHEAIDPFVNENFDRLAFYSGIMVSYDRGQKQISQLITETLENRFANVRVTTTLPVHFNLNSAVG